MSKIKAFKKKRQKAKSVKEGAKEYVPEIRIQAMLKTTFMMEPSKTLSSPARTGTMTTACTAGNCLIHWKHFWNKVIDWFINNL